ncbi:hypothetical protein D3C85_1009810 [compost metagenome]
MAVIVLIVIHGAHGFERSGREHQDIALALATEYLPRDQGLFVFLQIEQAFEALKLVENEQIRPEMRSAASGERHAQIAHQLAFDATVTFRTQTGSPAQSFQQ